MVAGGGGGRKWWWLLVAGGGGYRWRWPEVVVASSGGGGGCRWWWWWPEGIFVINNRLEGMKFNSTSFEKEWPNPQMKEFMELNSIP